MASKAHSSVFSILFVSSILLAVIGEAAAGREIPKDAKNVDKKEPEWFKHDRSFLIPGVGRVMVPPVHSGLHFPPGRGGSGIVGITRAPPRRHIPGADDTFAPNPGFEVPTPVGGGLPAPGRP